MKNYTLNDPTQQVILPALEITENLITKAITLETGQTGHAEIIAMPDLGFANNYLRMKGGFFTGMYVNWESPIPFIPVDATVNSCGVSVFLLKEDISFSEFQRRVLSAKEKLKNSSYNWNYERGNHFISIGQLSNGKICVVMHSSADEYKRSIADSSLYPEQTAWYYDNIHTIESDDGNRFLRYIVGKDAERFISIATSLEKTNHHRMKYMANLLFNDMIEDEVLYAPHYGMPTANSIAIGCSWKTDTSILLTIPGKDVYIVKPNKIINQPQWLLPHGLGSIADTPSVYFEKRHLMINDQTMTSDFDISTIPGKRIRFSENEKETYQSNVQQILKKCNATIELIVHPWFGINKDGFNKYI